MIAKFKIFNTLSRNDDDYLELFKSRDMLTINRMVPETNGDAKIKLMLTREPMEIIRHNTYKSYCNNAIVHLKEGDSIPLYPIPEKFLSVELKNEPILTIKEITKEKVVVEITNRKDKMNISNGGTELGSIVINELEEDIAEMTINVGIGYNNFSDNKENISQNIFLMEILDKENNNV